MTCPRCQAQTPEEARFCEECGARLALACPQCGAEISPGKKFCRSCGTSLSGRVPDRPLSPATYTPKHLAEKILTSKAALEGERKQVTVLFADLKGSMELLADRDPEDARKLLDPVLERMMEAVHRYEGTVNQVMGDGIMALFGAPLAHEDHAVRACYAALDMQTALRRYAEEIRRAHGVDVQVRVGLNSGEVVVRTIGSDLRMDYSAVGQTTHLAARMEQLARPGVTLLTAATLRLAEGYVEVTPLGPVPLKGLADSVEVYELVGLGLSRSRLGAAAARGLTPFVGRETESEHLRQALGHAGAGHGQVVAIVGEPGVGKSRLVWEVTHSHRTHEWLMLHASSVSYGKATPYLPVIDLLKGYFQIEDRDDHRRLREKVIGKLLNLEEALRSNLPAFLALLDVPVDDPQWEGLDPLQRRQRILDAVKRLVLHESQVQPLLAIFEDLHWIDAETQALLDGLVESLPTARLLLLVNFRPEYQHGWGSKTYYTQLRLDSLPPETAQALLDTLLGVDPSLEDLKGRLVERTEGNPFFLEETVRSLAETNALVGERSAYRLTEPLHAIRVPATVQAILAARIDRLPLEAKSLLQTAAVIGPDVPVRLLQALVDRAEPAVCEDLARLQAAEFLYETRFFPDLEYTFKHALTQEVAYGGLLQERRRALHARAVHAIERCYPERLAEHVERLAHHALRGEAWEKAVLYLREAGVKAMARSAYREAATAYEQALDALRRLPESRQRIGQTVDIHLEASWAQRSAGAPAKITEHAREAEALAEALGDERRLGWALVWRAMSVWGEGEPDRARELSHRALTIAMSHADVRLEILVNHRLGMIEQQSGGYRSAADCLRRAANALRKDPLNSRPGTVIPTPAMVIGRLGWCLAELGEFDEAMASSEEAVRLAREVNHPASLVSSDRSVGIVSLLRGDGSRAIPPLERAVDVCRSTPLLILFDMTAGHLGYAYALAGRLSEGVALLEEALAHSATTGTADHALLLAYLGEAHLLSGHREAALAVTRRALELARRQKERGNEAWVLRLLGQVAVQDAAPDLESAETHYGQALARANDLGMRPLVAHCHLGLGTLYRRTGDQAKSDEHLATATTMYREMDMGFWREKADRATNAVD